MLPGMDVTGNLFNRFVAVLPSSFDAQIVRYPTETALSYAELRTIVLAATRASEPFLLLAESFSTPVAIEIAATNPTYLRGLILCSGFATSPITGWRRTLCYFISAVVFRVPIPSIAVSQFLVGADSLATLIEEVRLAIASVPPRILCARLRLVLACNLIHQLRQVRVPVLYIQGDKDKLIPASCVEELTLAKPEVKVSRIEGPHLILQRAPE